MTGIFINRFFNHMKFKDIAVKYYLADHMAAGKIHRETLKRLYKILDVLERERVAKKHLDVKRTEKRKKAI